jgi:hypothetical protein
MDGICKICLVLHFSENGSNINNYNFSIIILFQLASWGGARLSPIGTSTTVIITHSCVTGLFIEEVLRKPTAVLPA